jgi:hypothetical protein
MVNGVLVERTVQEVLPTLKTNSDGLKQVLEDMLKQYKSKQSELDSWKVRMSRHEESSCSKSSPSYEPGTVLTCFSFTEEEQHPGCAALMASLFYIFIYVSRYRSSVVLSKCESMRLPALLGTAKD